MEDRASVPIGQHLPDDIELHADTFAGWLESTKSWHSSLHL